jgi:LuxR family maltose regulon positive regulatory protein
LHEQGDECIQSDPVWVLELLLGLMGLARPQEAPVWLERIQDAHPEADGPLMALIEGTWNEHHQTHGQPIQALQHLDRAGEAVGWRPPNVGLVSLLWVTKARAHIQAGQFELAAAALEEGHRHPVGNALADEARNRGVAAFVAAVQGELNRAADLSRAATEAADGLGLSGHELGRVYAALAVAEVHVERHELERASDAFAVARAIGEANRRVNVQSQVTLQQARLARALGDEAESNALLVQAGLWFTEPDEALRRVLAEEAVAQALRFDPTRAAPLIAELGPDVTTTRVLSARLALFEGDDRIAAGILDELPPATSRRARVERDVLRALSVLERDVDRANEHLGAALDAGQSDGLVRTFIEHGPSVHKLLLSFTPDSTQERYVDHLLAAASQGVAPVRVTVAQALIDPLSARELTVLRYLCSRLTYVEIASALYVSINTLKSHVRTVYRKLEVASRADAVAAGRGLGLI